MRNLTATIYLTLALLLGGAGVSWSADRQKGLDAARRGDFATALREWKPLAEHGDAKAQSYLGGMYQAGQGVTQDFKEGVKWIRQSAEQWDAEGQFSLGRMYDQGWGVTQDKVYAHTYHLALGYAKQCMLEALHRGSSREQVWTTRGVPEAMVQVPRGSS